MNAPAAQTSPADDAPDFFTGTSFAVEEILLGMNVLQAKVRNLKQGNDTGSAVQQKLAAEEAAKIAGQIQSLADVIVRVTISHLNRKPRA
jgi:predicted nucleic acid-binding protein